jgi:hypothetical protein
VGQRGSGRSSCQAPSAPFGRQIQRNGGGNELGLARDATEEARGGRKRGAGRGDERLATSASSSVAVCATWSAPIDRGFVMRRAPGADQLFG